MGVTPIFHFLIHAALRLLYIIHLQLNFYRMRTKTTHLLFLILNTFVFIGLSAQIPFVYNAENTATGFSAPPLPTVSTATRVYFLPDPYKFADGSSSTAFTDWEHHRSDFKAYLENYEIGTKPSVDKATQVTASYSSGTLTINITANGQTMTMTCAVSIPSGATAPYPVCIGMNSSYGSMTASEFTSRGIVGITFSHDQVTSYSSPSNTNPFFRLYPTQNIDNTGQYAAWAWGVSRIIDGLEKVKAAGTFNVDLNHIAVSGCSYAGKMALFSGAFDERVALTLAQESGGGGATSWRYSKTRPDGEVEGLAQTNSQWFKNSMFDFGGDNVYKLPDDHHMLMAMCAPRALFATGNTDYTWLSNMSFYVCNMACAKIYSDLGISDRFGFVLDGGHSHCAVPTGQNTQLGYFLNKFMKDQTSLSQTYRIHPAAYDTINYARWYSTWGGNTNVPVTGVSISPTSATINVGGTQQLTATVSPANATNNSVTWSSNNTAVATVSSTGLVTAVAVGSATITVTTVDQAKNATCAVTVTPSTANNKVMLEAECGTVGSLFSVASDATASNSTYATVKAGNNSTASAPTDATGWITLPFSVGQTGTYAIWFRTECPDANGDSFWVKMDNGSFAMWNSIPVSAAWQWNKFATTYSLTTTGNHTLIIGYREDGAKLDKIYITSAGDTPSGSGSTASNICTPVLKTTSSFSEGQPKNTYSYPNPVSETLNVALTGSLTEISLYTNGGQLLWKKTTGKMKETIDMIKYQPGVYVLKITAPDQTVIEKVVKR